MGKKNFDQALVGSNLRIVNGHNEFLFFERIYWAVIYSIILGSDTLEDIVWFCLQAKSFFKILGDESFEWLNTLVLSFLEFVLIIKMYVLIGGT